jgi:hypothetical protein
MGWTTWLVIGIIAYLVIVSNPEWKQKAIDIFNSIKSSVGGSDTKIESNNDGNITVLGPVYQEVPCAQDLECQEWYKCQGCYCNTVSGKCEYD